MTCSRSPASAFRCLVKFLVVACVTVICLAQAGTYVSIQEVRVSGLPVLIAPSHQPMDVLLTSLATIIHDKISAAARSLRSGTVWNGPIHYL